MPGTTTNGLPYPLNSEPLGDVADAIKALAEALDGSAVVPVRGKAKRATSQSLTAATETTVLLDATDYLVGGVTLATNRLVVPAGAGGLYTIQAGCQWAENNGANNRSLQLQRNDVDVPDARSAFRPNSVTDTGAQVGVELVLAAGDTLRLRVRQDTTGALALTYASLSIRKVA